MYQVNIVKKIQKDYKKKARERYKNRGRYKNFSEDK